jgi:hypothetical protein
MHRALAEGTLPGGRLVRGRCICCRVCLVEQSPAERQQLFLRERLAGQPK